MKLRSYYLFLFLIISLSGQAQPKRIKHFNNLVESLNAGGRVRVVLHYAKCRLVTDNPDQISAPDAIAGMDIDTYEYFAPGAAHNIKAFLVFSQMKLIQNPKGKGFVYNYGKVRISENDSVIVSAKYLNPKNFNVVMDETFLGKMNDGTNSGGIDLFETY